MQLHEAGGALRSCAHAGDSGEYRFDAAKSSTHELVFVRGPAKVGGSNKAGGSAKAAAVKTAGSKRKAGGKAVVADRDEHEAGDQGHDGEQQVQEEDEDEGGKRKVRGRGAERRQVTDKHSKTNAEEGRAKRKGTAKEVAGGRGAQVQRGKGSRARAPR